MKTTWTRYLLAAALILLVGAVWALAEEIEMNVEVSNEAGQEVTVDVNGVQETVYLDDLAEGEERSYDVGGYPITIRRVDDELTIVHEGGSHAMIHEIKGDSSANMVWVTEDEEIDDGAHKIVIVKRGGGEFTDEDGNVMIVGDGGHGDHEVLVFTGEDGEIDIEALKEKYGDDFEEIETADGKRVLKWIGEGGAGHPYLITTGDAQFFSDDQVVFRCEETGSVLTVKDDGHLLDTYLDPVTGCVMKKMDSPARKVIRVEVITEDETGD
jgi:hypothetical protein